MLVKVKSLKFSAGKYVAIIPEYISKKLDVNVGERLSVKRKRGEKKVICIVDTAVGLLKKNEIAVSSEVIKKLGLKEKEYVEVDPTLTPLSTNFILKKLNNYELSYTEVFSIIKDIVNNKLTETEIAYFVSSMYIHGMSDEETLSLIAAMVRNGIKLDINKGRVFDKHSIGGIAGNRTTPIIVSICAAAGLTMPKTSSRAITSASGTADVVEVLSNVEFSAKEIKNIVKKTGACFVWGGSLGLAPADDKIIQVERILGIDPQAQLIASILAKKVSAGATDFLLDIPYGEGAKVNEQEAKKLAKKFHKMCKMLKINAIIALTDGQQPIGNGVGPVLEMRDILSILVREKNRPLDLEIKSVVLAGLLLELADKAKSGEGKRLASYLLNSGRAMSKFKEIIRAQGGTFINIEKKLELSKFKKIIRTKKLGKIVSIDNKKINFLARIAGCPADKKAGIYLHKKTGDIVKKNDPIVTIYAESKRKLKYAVKIFKKTEAIIIK
jgi:AMP phosphorylase